MHLRCVSLTILHNLVHFLLIISIVFQTTYSQQKESIPEFENFPIIDSELDRNEEESKQRSDPWMSYTSSSSITVENVGFDRVLPKFSSGDEVVDHVINSGVIENLETEELEKISKKYNHNHSHNKENIDYENRNNDYENQELKTRNNKNRRTHSIELLEKLIQVYKFKSSGILAKRGEGPQLSIVNPLDVLRQRLLLELARRRMKENQDQIQANAEILRKIGKRSINAIGSIPPQTVLRPTQESVITNITGNSHLSDRRRDQRFMNANTNKSYNKCQKCRRKRGLNRLFLDQ